MVCSIVHTGLFRRPWLRFTIVTTMMPAATVVSIVIVTRALLATTRLFFFAVASVNTPTIEARCCTFRQALLFSKVCAWRRLKGGGGRGGRAMPRPFDQSSRVPGVTDHCSHRSQLPTAGGSVKICFYARQFCTRSIFCRPFFFFFASRRVDEERF